LEFDLLRPPEEQPAPAVRLARRLRTAIYETEMRRAAASPVPGSAWDLVLRGDAALNAGNDRVTDARDARKLYDEALRIDPSFVPALLSIPNAVLTVMYNDPDADRSRFVQELDELDKLTTRAVSVDPKDASAWYIRSNVLVELRRLEEALAADAKAEALDPFNATFTAQHAAIALMLDQPDEALALAELCAWFARPTSCWDAIAKRCQPARRLQSRVTCGAIRHGWLPDIRNKET
jgi:tetratricopeptide (TPR) repeat protein